MLLIPLPAERPPLLTVKEQIQKPGMPEARSNLQGRSEVRFMWRCLTRVDLRSKPKKVKWMEFKADHVSACESLSSITQEAESGIL